ncbi:7703_t:CDS:2 [Gigaspora margarita]|uniref:7703_t:CDS:1 n=1 Tax=Gigaspora margarita TaxID=4874 RepID=A0ABN7VKY8_GIGMA|nr:7703_t:CDS:2 [Gigaspora margarita]
MNENSNKNMLFDSIFIETYSELTTLNNEFNELYKSYNTTEDSDELVNEEIFFIESQTSDDSITTIEQIESDCFTQQEVALFQQIYQTNSIHHFIEDEEKKDRMSEQDNQAFITKIQQVPCCNKNCFNTSINNDEALKRFCKVKSMSAAEKNMFLLGMLEARVLICQKSWYTIYAIGKSKWEAVRAHYLKNNISPIVHGLKGHVSNHAIKFETVLHILTFIQNFAAQHGLPSPGHHFHKDIRPIIYLPACESYYSLFRLYNDTIESSQENTYTISQSSFSRIWKHYLPGIKFLTARSDLCMQCKEMRFSAKRWTQSEPLNKLNECSNHYSWASLEREYYR